MQLSASPALQSQKTFPYRAIHISRPRLRLVLEVDYCWAVMLGS